MSLSCGECRSNRNMYGSYYMLYRLEQLGPQVGFASGGKRDYVSPNCAICKPCVGDALEKGGSSKAKHLVGDYALVPGDSGGGAAMWSGITVNPDEATFYGKDFAEREWPKVIEIIDGMAQGNPTPSFKPSDTKFFKRLIDYLSTCKFKVVSMVEVAPSAIIVADNYGNGEQDLYFDSRDWSSTSKAMPMSFMTQKPGFRSLKLGVLEGVSFSSPPRNASEFIQLGGQIIKPNRGMVWHERPLPLTVPSELLPEKSV